MREATEAFEAMTADQLARVHVAMELNCVKAIAALAARCGDGDEARRRVRLATELPASVLRRSARRACETVEAGDEPTVDEVAALIACQMASIDLAAAILTRKREARAVH